MEMFEMHASERDPFCRRVSNRLSSPSGEDALIASVLLDEVDHHLTCGFFRAASRESFLRYSKLHSWTRTAEATATARPFDCSCCSPASSPLSLLWFRPSDSSDESPGGRDSAGERGDQQGLSPGTMTTTMEQAIRALRPSRYFQAQSEPCRSERDPTSPLEAFEPDGPLQRPLSLPGQGFAWQTVSRPLRNDRGAAESPSEPRSNVIPRFERLKKGKQAAEANRWKEMEPPSAPVSDRVIVLPGSCAVVNAIAPKYKTEMCRNYMKDGRCPVENQCLFAHGSHELRERFVAGNYKREVCKAFAMDGRCRYGSRCTYRHEPTELSGLRERCRPGMEKRETRRRGGRQGLREGLEVREGGIEGEGL